MAGRADTHFFSNTTEVERARIKLAENASDSDKLSAMKTLVQLISDGVNASGVFPEVVKTIICKDVRVQRLAYFYLMYYAEFKPEEALLCVNTLQMHMKSSNPVIRAQSLRVLTSIRLSLLIPIQLLSIDTGVKDSSPYVRKAAYLGIIKIYQMDSRKKVKLMNFIKTGLGDSSMFSLSAILAAYWEICPLQYDYIQPHFKKYCQCILDMDSWGQVYLLKILTYFARNQFDDPNKGMDNNSTKVEEDDEDWSEFSDSEEIQTEQRMDPDLSLLLKNANTLLSNANSSVVIAAASLIYYCAPENLKYTISKPLMRTARSKAAKYGSLVVIRTISQTRPDIFTGYLSEFYLHSTDSCHISKLKLDILVNLTSKSTWEPISSELKYYLSKRDYFPLEITSNVIVSLRKCASKAKKFKKVAIRALLNLLNQESKIEVISCCLVEIKRLLQLDPSVAPSVVSQLLATEWNQITNVEARSCIIWIFGEYCPSLRVAPNILRILLKDFTKESDAVKYQIINLATKVFINYSKQESVALMFQYACNLCKYDMSFDIRDKSRLLEALILNNNCPTLKKNIISLLCSTKPPVMEPLPREDLLIGSLSHCVGMELLSHHILPDWSAQAFLMGTSQGFNWSDIEGSEEYSEEYEEDEEDSDDSEDAIERNDLVGKESDEDVEDETITNDETLTNEAEEGTINLSKNEDQEETILDNNETIIEE